MALYAATLGGMKSRIGSEISRSDLSVQIENAINDAIIVYQKERFRFSETIPNAPPTFSTVAARWIYTSADNANIGTALNIDYVLMNVGTTVMWLIREQPATIKLYNQQGTMSGQPGSFGYEGNQLMLSPIPDQAYLITLGLFRAIAAPASDSEASNPWMTDAERLIRARAKYELATHVTRNAAMAQAMSPSPPSENGGVVGASYREWKSLKAEANRITSLGRVRSMQF